MSLHKNARVMGRLAMQAIDGLHDGSRTRTEAHNSINHCCDKLSALCAQATGLEFMKVRAIYEEVISLRASCMNISCTYSRLDELVKVKP